MTTRTDVPAAILELARSVARIVREELGPGTRLWLFGSWARGVAAPRSDLDVAFECGGPTDIVAKLDAQERVEHLPTLRSIDLVDLEHSGDHIRSAVLREGIPL